MPVEYGRMREIAEEMSKLPESWAVEISGGEIIMMMSPANRHKLIVLRTARQLNRQLEKTATTLVAHGGADVEDAAVGILRRPDLLVLPEAALDNADTAVNPKEVHAAFEVVSKANPENDYTGKMRDYALVGIPCYVILDPRPGTGVVLCEVGPGEQGEPAYLHREPFVFGDTVSIGRLTLDTSQFPMY